MISRHFTNRHAALCWLMGAAAVAFACAGPARGEEPTSLADRTWTWGYVIPGKIPGHVPFVFPNGSGCSLETAATYLGTPNVVLMNYTWAAPGYLERLTGFKRVLCAIAVRDVAAAARLSALSKKYPNIIGAMIDDFYPVQEKVTVDELKAVYTALKSENPSLKLYVVRYTHSKDEEVVPFLPYFDAINLWVWEASKEAWGPKMDQRIEDITRLTHKPILMGLFLHNYGEPPPKPKPEVAWSWTKVQSQDVVEAQFVKTTELLRKDKIDGFVMLQSGWLDHESHRSQVQWVKQYLEWLFGTQTVRK